MHSRLSCTHHEYCYLVKTPKTDCVVNQLFEKTYATMTVDIYNLLASAVATVRQAVCVGVISVLVDVEVGGIMMIDSGHRAHVGC